MGSPRIYNYENGYLGCKVWNNGIYILQYYYHMEIENKLTSCLLYTRGVFDMALALEGEILEYEGD